MLRPQSPRAKFLRNVSKRSAKNAAKFWRNFSQLLVLRFPGKMAADIFTKNPRHFPRCTKLSFFAAATLGASGAQWNDTTMIPKNGTSSFLGSIWDRFRSASICYGSTPLICIAVLPGFQIYINQKNVRIPIPPLLLKKVSKYTSNLYCNYASNLYHSTFCAPTLWGKGNAVSTPPIWIAVRLPFVLQYRLPFVLQCFWESLGGCGHRDVALSGVIPRESENRVIRANRPERAIKIGISIANDSRELIRANRIANCPCH